MPSQLRCFSAKQSHLQALSRLPAVFELTLSRSLALPVVTEIDAWRPDGSPIHDWANKIGFVNTRLHQMNLRTHFGDELGKPTDAYWRICFWTAQCGHGRSGVFFYSQTLQHH